YGLTLSPHSFLWFSLASDPAQLGPARQGARAGVSAKVPVPVLAVEGPWRSCLEGKGRQELEAALLDVLPTRGWFLGAARALRNVEITEAIPVGDAAALVLLEVDYADVEGEIYALPLTFAPAADSRLTRRLRRAGSPPIVVRLESDVPEGTGLLYDPIGEPAFSGALLEAIAGGKSFRGGQRELAAEAFPALPEIRGEGNLTPSLLRAGDDCAPVRFGDRLVLKLHRKLEAGVNPDLEIRRFLAERTDFRHVPRLAGALEIRERRSEPMSLGVLEEYVPNEGDAWSYTQDALGRYFDRVLAVWETVGRAPVPVPSAPLLELAERRIPGEDFERIGTYLPTVRLLGERTAELHIALASGAGKDFEPEPFSELYQRSLFDSMRSVVKKNFRLLRQNLQRLSPPVREAAEQVLAAEERIIERFRRLTERKLAAQRTRIHGAYHLARLLYTGRDFVILEFEGEPWRSLSERRLKRSPLRDVASMLRSFQYAAYVKLFEETAAGMIPAESLPALEGWALLWERWVSAAFLQAYLQRARGAPFLSPAAEETAILLDSYLLKRAVNEIVYELDHRPDWVRIPLQGIRQILGE